MKIITISEKSEEKFLRQTTKLFDFSLHSREEIRELIKEMRAIMEKSDGIGLAANQVGLDYQMFVAQVDGKFYAVFNPEIAKSSKETEVLEEGCLSIPGVYDEVKRPDRVVLQGYDKNGKKLKIKAWGLLARVFQHEVDHLNGKVFLDRVKK